LLVGTGILPGLYTAVRQQFVPEESVNAFEHRVQDGRLPVLW
jgi:hypothetical protein